jgi:hypothetical protein
VKLPCTTDPARLEQVSEAITSILRYGRVRSLRSAETLPRRTRLGDCMTWALGPAVKRLCKSRGMPLRPQSPSKRPGQPVDLRYTFRRSTPDGSVYSVPGLTRPDVLR